MAHELATTLRSRTYIGLILSQFLAAFNDQAIHIVAIFYASDMLVRYVGVPHVDEKVIVSIVTACFITPFFIFSTLAGMLADRFSKQKTLIFWKLAEVAIMGGALFGFVLPHLSSSGAATPQSLATWSAVLVVATVFLMGTHSAFFVPAKYGVMPEILHASILSRGNGLLEGTSFVAQIIGTSVGGYLYGMTKSSWDASGVFTPGKEWIIGGLLFGLAVVGAFASFMIEPIPAAAPNRPLTWKLWQPLTANVGILLKSRPLALSVLGIAFFTFMTLFLRQSLIYEGEIGKELHSAEKLLAKTEGVRLNGGGTADDLNLLDKTASADQKAELRIALLIAMIGLGVGIGSSLAGWLSGKKVELGLVPIGCVLLILFNTILAVSLGTMWALIPTLILIGVSAGLYIVPLYTLLQHGAPKDSKGGLVATSNFINVAGGLLAIIAFYVLTMILERILGTTLSLQQVRANPELLRDYIAELQRQIKLPSVLCLVASVMTAGMLFLLCKQLPDFLVRTLLWLRSQGKYHLHVSGIQYVPSSGPAILATNCEHFEDSLHIVASTDRYVRFFLFEEPKSNSSRALERYVARQTGLVTLPPEGCPPAQWQSSLQAAVETLAAGEIVGLTTVSQRSKEDAIRFLDELKSRSSAPVLPVRCSVADPDVRDAEQTSARRVQVSIGKAMRPTDGATQTVLSIMSLSAR